MGKSALTYRDVIGEIKKQNFAPVYLLMGDEPYYIDKVVEALEDGVVSPSDRDFNYITYYGADTKIDTVIGSVQQLPMMGERILVVLKEAQGLSNAKITLDKLAPYISHPNPTTVFVIAYKGEELSGTSKIMKAAEQSGAVVFKSKKFRDYQLATPIKEYCASKGIKIDSDAITMLGDYVGTSLEALFGAIDKISISQGNNQTRINTGDVAANIGLSKEFNTYELVNAIGEKNYSKSQLILHYFRNNPKQNPTVVVSTQLFNFFTKLVLAHLSKDKSDNALMALTGARNAYALQSIKNSMRLYNLRQSVLAISAIRDFDAKSKGIGSFQGDQGLLSDLVFTLFTLR